MDFDLSTAKPVEDFDLSSAKPVKKETPIPSDFDVARQAATQGIAAIPDIVINAPSNVWNLAKAGVGTIADIAGHPELAPEVSQGPSPVTRLAEMASLITPEFEPQTTGQKILSAGTQGAVGGLLTGNPMSAVIGAGSNIAGQQVAERTGSPLSGVLTGLITGGGASALLNKAKLMATEAMNARQQALADKQSLDAKIIQSLDKGKQHGLVVAPSEIPGSETGRSLESVAGKTQTEATASLKNADKMHNAFAEEIGLPKNQPIYKGDLNSIRSDSIKSGYDPIRKIGAVTPDNQYYADLRDIAKKEASSNISFEDKTPISDFVKKLVPNQSASFNSGSMLDKISQLRSKANDLYKSGDTDLANAHKQAANALEDLIERHMEYDMDTPSNLLKNYRDARKAIAKTYTVEEALDPASGKIDPRKVAALDIRSNKMEGPMRDMAEFARNFPKSTKSPHVAQSQENVSTLGVGWGAGVGAGTGAAFGHAVGMPTLGAAAGAAAGAKGTELLRQAVKAHILSPEYQQNLRPNYVARTPFLSRIPETDPFATAILPGLLTNQGNQ